MSLYPSPLYPRIAYDKEGAAAFENSPSYATVGQLPASYATGFNAEDARFERQYGDGNAPWGTDGIVFPVPYDLYGYWSGHGGGSFDTGRNGDGVYYSTDTTNGLDGNWNYWFTMPGGTGISPQYRTRIQYPTPIFNVKGFYQNYAYSPTVTLSSARLPMHVYGYPSGSPDKLTTWHPTLNQAATGLDSDFGDPQRLTTNVRAFRVKNLSATKTARSIQVMIDTPLDDTNPSILTTHDLSLDNVTYPTNRTVFPGDLPPGGISQVIYLRFKPPTNDQVGLACGRVICQAAAFS